MDHGQLGSFGDRRLAEAGDALLAAMHQKRSMCLRELADDRNQELQFSRFLDNGAVSRHEILVATGRQTGERAAGRHVLVLADTSECNYTSHQDSKRGFGTVGNGKDIGVFVHPLVAVDADRGGVIGLVGAEVINRTAGKAEDHKTRPADEKESRRWLAGAETASEVLADAAMITMVEDREGDIYDQFARRPGNVHLLVRAAQNRSVGGGEKLFERCARWRKAGQPVPTKPFRRN